MKNNIKLLLASALIILTVAGSGCELLSSTTTITQRSTATTTAPAATTTVTSYTGGNSTGGYLDFSSVVDKVRPSVVQIETYEAAGTGWVIDSSGIIVTNAHVIEDVYSADEIMIITSDGTTYTATSFNSDVSSDLAIIRINATGLTAASVGSSAALKVGQPVAAIGNALSMGISMTGGWVSRLNATITDDSGTTYVDLIGTDTAINFGNSGGPLVNTSGEVVGITSIKLVEEGVEGVGYAISIDYAMPIVQQLISQGYVNRAYVGINGLTTVDSFVAARYDLWVEYGVMIGGVISGSPADSAGLEAYDVIIAVEEEEIYTNGQLVRNIQARAPGSQVEFTIYRGMEEMSITVTLGSTPAQAS